MKHSASEEPVTEDSPTNGEDESKMIALNACPKCKGTIYQYDQPTEDGPMCLNCGWRQNDIPQDVELEVRSHLGKPFMEDRYAHHRIATGKPPLSGWERIKRRRDRERRLHNRRNGANGNGSAVAM